MATREELKRIYDETALLIGQLFLNEKINVEERDFLLFLLDTVIIKKNNADFLDFLKEWMEKNQDSEIDQIIEATLLAIDFRNESSIKNNIEILKELLAARDAESEEGS